MTGSETGDIWMVRRLWRLLQLNMESRIMAVSRNGFRCIITIERELEATPVAKEVPVGASKRKICLEERIEIVQYCISHELDYA